MDDYTGLKPGLYLQVGNSIKTLQDGREYWGAFHNLFIRGTNTNPSVETLAAEVAWVWIALEKRKQKILEVPYSWQQNEEDINDVPFNMPFKTLSQQIDQSLQLYKCAYLLKQRGAFSQDTAGVRWLDPVTIEPDYDTADPAKGGIQRFKRWKENRVTFDFIPARDMIHFVIPGMRELTPDISAVRATSLTAQILRGMSQTLDTFMDNNALPIMLVKIPASTPDQERDRLENRFKRLFNKMTGSTEIRTTAVRSADVEVVPLSFKPTELDMENIEPSRRDAILAAHDVPLPLVLTGATTYENAAAAERNMIGAMGTRLDFIAETFNADPDFETAGYILDIRANDHWAMKEDESQRATSFSTYVNGGLTPKAALWLVGISEDDFPSDIGEIFKEERIPEQLEQFSQQGQQPPMATDNEAREQEEQAFKRWLKKRSNPNPGNFTAYYMTPEEKQFVFYDVVGQQRMDDTLDQFAGMMKRLEPVLVGENGNNESV